MVLATRGWRLKRVDIVPGEPALVTFSCGNETARFRTRRFAVGRRGAKTAALAKFVARSGFGDAEELYHWFASLWPDYTGPIPVEGLDMTVDMAELEAE